MKWIGAFFSLALEAVLKRDRRGRMNLNMEDLEMVNGGTVVREQGECVMGKVERKHVHNDVQVSEEWISPPGGVYYRILYRCTQCGEEHYGDWVNIME